MVDYVKIPTNWKPPEPEPDEDQAVLEPQVEVVINSYHEKGDTRSFAFKISIRLPLNS